MMLFGLFMSKVLTLLSAHLALKGSDRWNVNAMLVFVPRLAWLRRSASVFSIGNGTMATALHNGCSGVQSFLVGKAWGSESGVMAVQFLLWIHRFIPVSPIPVCSLVNLDGRNRDSNRRIASESYRRDSNRQRSLAVITPHQNREICPRRP